MADNPYSPPQAEVSDRPPGRRGSRLKAVIVGCVVDFFGTTLFGVVVTFLLGIGLGAKELSSEELARQIVNSPLYQAFSLGYGMAFTVLGGFVAARIANYLEYRTALWVGFIGLVIGELLVGASPDAIYPTWSRIVGDMLIMPAALFGANLKVKRFGKG